jgi:hypothetical protein
MDKRRLSNNSDETNFTRDTIVNPDKCQNNESFSDEVTTRENTMYLKENEAEYYATPKRQKTRLVSKDNTTCKLAQQLKSKD